MPKRKRKKEKIKKRKNKIKKKTNFRARKPKKIKSKSKKKSKPEEGELIYKTKSEWSKNALVNKSEYEKKYSISLKDNDGFWKKEGKRITWIKPYTKIKDVNTVKKMLI